MKRLDERLDAVESALVTRHNSEPQSDFRGRKEADDLRQWAYPDETLKKLHELRKTAASNDPQAARAALDEARATLDAATSRAKSIEIYWATGDAPHWRQHWDAFAAANTLPASSAQPSLLALESNIASLLEQGDFERAALEATPLLDKELHALMTSAQNEKARNTASDSLKFQPRQTPCPESNPSSGTPESKARMTRGAPLEDYYPPSSIRREEQGDIVLRAHINEAGCATDVAIVVYSGYPDLDAAALKWFESGRFLPQLKDGKPADAEITFKVRFKLKDVVLNH